MSYAVVTLKKGEGRTLKAGGAWIFDNEIESITGGFDNGSLVLVHDFDGYPMGRGFINQNSKIRVRMMTRNIHQEIDESFLRMRVKNAWEYRKTIVDTSSCRLIFGEADFLPGLTVDKYEDVLVVECLALGMEAFKETIVKLLKEVLAEDGVTIRGVYERSDANERKKEGLPKAEKAKKVYVIGGGVAGMCAAFTAKRRGHDVTLFEATDKLGGNMRLAAYPPGKGDITGMIRSYIVKCEKAGVNIKMNTKVTAQMLKEDTPDAVILATGAETLVLPFIKGIENPDIVYGVDCLEGTRPVGHKVLVVGGGMVGAETADFLAEQGHEVAIIEMRDAIGPDVIHEHRIFLMEAFEKYGIKQITSAAVSEIFSDGVSYKNAADKSDETIYEARGFDTVVLSMGFSSRYTHRDGQNVVYDFAEELKDIVPEVHMVGDAVRARRALDATKEAYEVALNL